MNLDISIKTTFSEVKAITDLIIFDDPPIKPGHDGKKMKRYLSILQDTREKLIKKLVSKRTTHKEFKLTFRYHEADALQQTLLLCTFNTDHPAQKFLDKIDQKLA